MDTMAEEAPGADSIAVRPESQISIKTGASPNQQEIERRREIVRQFFNDFWISAEVRLVMRAWSMPNFRAGLFSQSSNRILNGRFGFFPIRIRPPIT